MRIDRMVRTLGTLALLAAAPLAHAHTFGAHGAGFGAGFAHPFMGLDHLAAMFAAGLWAAQLGGSAVWRVPAAFIATMCLGAVLACTGMALPGVEAGIGASVLVLGLLVAFAARLPTHAGMALAGVFALFHGYAHGCELPLSAAPLWYALGFIIATVSVHAAGLAAGVPLRNRAMWMARACGAMFAAGGLWLLAN